MMTLDQMPKEILTIIFSYTFQGNCYFLNVRSVSSLFRRLTKDIFDCFVVDKILDSYELWKKKFQPQDYQKMLCKSLTARQEALQENNLFLSKMYTDLETLGAKGNSYAQLALFKSHCFFWYKTRMMETENNGELIFQDLVPQAIKNAGTGLNYLRLAATANSEALALLNEFIQDQPSIYNATN